MKMSLEGLSECSNSLEALDRKVKGKIISTAVKAGANVIRTYAVAEAPMKSGQTAQAIKVRGGGFGKSGKATANVGVGAKDYVGDQFYAAFVLFGHKVGKRSLGDKRKDVAPNNWLERAYEQGRDDAIETVSTEIIEGIEASKGTA